MTLKQIEELPICDVLAKNTWVFLWTTQKFLPASYDIIKKWGLKYRFTMTWVKSGGFQVYNYPQFNSEFIICGTIGNPKLADAKKFNTAFSAPRGKHSEKPSEFYELIIRVCGDVKD